MREGFPERIIKIIRWNPEGFLVFLHYQAEDAVENRVHRPGRRPAPKKHFPVSRIVRFPAEYTVLTPFRALPRHRHVQAGR